ncbi:phosphopantetheine-binding protein, partial [Pedobacter sp. UYP1]|uniref:phosphopantetheine-binding protein n=1 Tax=Pedobacter sp. UYP1 TaxID=1756396 RepID=UPI003391172E
HFVAARSKELPGWKAVGLAGMAFTEQDIKNENTQNRFLLTPQEVAGLFEWSLLTTDSPVLAESTVDLPKRILEVYNKKEIISDEFSLKNMNKTGRPTLSSIYAAPFTKTEIALNVIFEEFFAMSGIGINDDFFELGGDSLKGMMMLKRIKKEFSVNVPLKDFFEKKNIREVANYIDEIRFLFEDTTATTDKTIII